MTKQRVPLVIVTGLSGSGKSTALKALEDLGYFCTDNLPAPLLEQFLDLWHTQASPPPVAAVLDVRGAVPVPREHPAPLTLPARLGHSDPNTVEILFLDCADDELVRRFAATRREHPLRRFVTSLPRAIALERELVAPLGRRATATVDTTGLNPHELRRFVMERFSLEPDASERRTRVRLLSFGFRFGLPPEAHFVFDARSLPNPYWEPALRPLAGTAEEVREYLRADAGARAYVAALNRWLDFAVARHHNEKRVLVTVAVGCTGGRHRSVFVVEEVAAHLRQAGWPVEVFHRDVGRA